MADPGGGGHSEEEPPCHILLVEDDECTLRMVAAMLRHCDYRGEFACISAGLRPVRLLTRAQLEP